MVGRPTTSEASAHSAELAPELQEFLAQGTPTRESVEAFLEGREFPLVDKDACTFVYHGAADAVRLRHWIYGLSGTQLFQRVPDTDFWTLGMELPAGSRVEYKLEVQQGDTVRLLEDPLNPHHAQDPFGSNSVAHAHSYERPEWTFPDPAARPGSLEERLFESKALRGPRKVIIYLPARYRPQRRYPLLVVHDGSDFLRFSQMQTVLDNLIHRLEIPPLVVAMVDPGDRLHEYAASPAHARFLNEELVPRLEESYPLVGAPEGRGLLGASFGAVASFATAWRKPRFYGKLLLLSGSFAFSDIGEHPRGPAFDPVVEFINRYRSRPRRVASKVFLSCGVHESLIYENRSFLPILQGTGMDVRYVEARDGHNWENWRDRLREGLSWTFPGPLWMVYE